ncbi:glycosyltransferase [Candidatus Saccharibacteria bacterium]|nr:glycosyltransferase [Candidatus Saccharibacteria bacterium]
MKKPKVAIVCDWLTNMAGAEQVVLAFHHAFPDAPIYTSVYIPEAIPALKNADVRTTYLQNAPKLLRSLHKFFPMLRVRAFRKLDLSEYDIILSSSSAEAKQVRKTRPDQLHICYCHTPIRYYWSHYAEYRENPGFGKLNWLVRLLMPLLVPRLKRADFKAAQNIDHFIANSNAVRDRIRRYYKKPADIIYPPVDTKRFVPKAKRKPYYVTSGRQIPYKKHALVIEACNQLELPLKVFGTGSEHENLRKLAGPTIEFFSQRYGNASDTALANALGEAKGFIFAADEDFGIVSVEAMASGAPVIAYGSGGSRDIVTSREVGVLFKHQTVEAIIAAIHASEKTRYSPTILRNRAKRFDKVLFVTQIRNYVYNAYERSRI